MGCTQYKIITLPVHPDKTDPIDKVGIDLGFAGGNGTLADPFEIDDADAFMVFMDLSEKGVYRSAYFLMTDDIVLTAPIEPITGFTGTFDGGYNTISGYRNNGFAAIADSDDPTRMRRFIALFAELDGGTLRNVSFENFNVSFPSDLQLEPEDFDVYASVAVGSLLNGGTVENVTVGDGKIESPIRASGVVGYATGGTATRPNKIIGCTSNADVTSNFDINHPRPTFGTAGGMLSTISGSDTFVDIINCTNTGTIVGYCAGGMLGDKQNANGIMTGCVNSGTVRGTAFAGGMVGDLWYGGSYTLNDCHNTGDIESYRSFSGINGGVYADANIGGLVGMAGIGGSLTITDSTNTGSLSNDISGIITGIGGIVGTFSGGNDLTVEDTTSDGTITNTAAAATTPNINIYSQGGIVGYLKTDGNTIIKNSLGSDNTTLTDGFAYGTIIGCGTTRGADKNTTIEFDQVTDVGAPFGKIHQQTNKAYTYRFINMDIDALIHGGAPNDYDTSVGTFYLTGSTIDNLRRIQTLGNMDSGPGSIILIDGTIGSLDIFPDGAWPAGSDPNPTYTLQNTSLSAWTNPTYNDGTGQNRYFTINDTRIDGTNGTWPIS